MTMITKVISGGQTGADEAGLIAAKEFGIETGGWLPQGCKTEFGAKPEYIELYGMKEHTARGYPARTRANVCDSDGTIRFAVNFNTAGERCTVKAIRLEGKPYIDIDMSRDYTDEALAKGHRRVAAWIEKHKIQVLNVAGNRESTRPGLCKKVQKFLKEVFVLVNGERKE
jgi:hypothetical protein